MECSRSAQVTLTVDHTHCTILRYSSALNMFTNTTKTDVALFALSYITLRYVTFKHSHLTALSHLRDCCYELITANFTAQRSLYVPHSDHYMNRPVVTICTTSLTFNNSTCCPHRVLMCFVWLSEQTAIISLYSINWLVFITETECVYCAVRTGSLYIILHSAHTVYLCVLCGSQNKQRLFPYTTLTDWFL